MKKKRLHIFLLIILSFFMFSKATYADSTKCSDINNEINNYYDIVEKLDDLNCNSYADSSVVNSCNEYNLRKAESLELLFEYNNEDNDCEKEILESIVEDNSETCSNSFDSEIKSLTSKVMTIFYVIAPFLLIIFVSIDLAKIVVSSGPDQVKDARKKIARRFLAFILLFISPAVVNILLSVVGDNRITGNSDRYICNTSIIYHKDTPKSSQTYISPSYASSSTILSNYSVTYDSSLVQSNISSEYYSKVKNIIDAGVALHTRYENEVWAYYNEYEYHTPGNNYSLYYYDIDKSTNGTKGTCCATYVSSVLYLSGELTATDLNGNGYNYCGGLSRILRNKGWVTITSYYELKPGDVVFMRNYNNDTDLAHVELFYGWGNSTYGLFYGAGSTHSIRKVGPYDKGDYCYVRFNYALRKP